MLQPINKSSILIALIALFLACNQNSKERVKQVSSENGIKHGTTTSIWKNFNTKDSIPSQFKAVLFAINADRKIANPDEQFEATDMIIDTSLARRRLTLLSKQGDEWRMSYQQGGIGTYNVYMQAEIRNDSIFHLQIGYTNLLLDNNDSIDVFLKQGRIKLKELKVNHQ